MGAFEFQGETGAGDPGNGEEPGGEEPGGGGEEPVPDEPVEMLGDLIDLLVDLQIPESLQDQLGQRLSSALNQLVDADPSNDVSAANKLGSFINSVEAQTGKKIPPEAAAELIDATNEVIAAIGN
jgi:hypothetical protein